MSLTWKRFEGVIINVNDTIEQANQKALAAINTKQANETDPSIGWFCALTHPRPSATKQGTYTALVMSDKLKADNPNIAQITKMGNEAELRQIIDDLTLTVNNMTTNNASTPTAQASVINNAMAVTVGPNGDYQKLSDALKFYSTKSVEYAQGGHYVDIVLQSGYVLDERINVGGIDLGFIYIYAENGANVVINTNLIEAGVSETTGIFEGAWNAKLPILGCSFVFNTVPTNNQLWFIKLNDNSVFKGYTVTVSNMGMCNGINMDNGSTADFQELHFKKCNNVLNVHNSTLTGGPLFHTGCKSVGVVVSSKVGMYITHYVSSALTKTQPISVTASDVSINNIVEAESVAPHVFAAAGSHIHMRTTGPVLDYKLFSIESGSVLYTQTGEVINKSVQTSDFANALFGIKTCVPTTILSTVSTAASKTHTRVILGTVIYFVYAASSTAPLKIDAYDTATNVWSAFTSTTNVVIGNVSTTVDTVNKKIYILETANANGSTPDITSKIYVFDITAQTLSLVTSYDAVVFDRRSIHFKNNFLYIGPGDSLVYDAVEETYIRGPGAECFKYNIATNVWETIIITNMPSKITAKYVTSSSGTNVYFEILRELNDPQTEVYTWYFGDPKIDLVDVYDRYEITSSISIGTGLCISSFKDYLLKFASNEASPYILMSKNSSAILTKKRIMLPITGLSKWVYMSCVGNNVYMFDKTNLTKIIKVDLTSYLA